jgi:hypothetical protein
MDLDTGRTAVTIDAGHTHTCALLDNNLIESWGHINLCKFVTFRTVTSNAIRHVFMVARTMSTSRFRMLVVYSLWFIVWLIDHKGSSVNGFSFLVYCLTDCLLIGLAQDVLSIC